ncbi:MAG TPA: hypothetical protein VFZ09_01265 [Archangium sp.]|uniref:hypothetical protein n=1 Tax=Archangium sp. TaxID=1872627 RepID=UPI002E3349BC|nr:hypothetical protein [Archangium sp.]HEX5744838.1 hypothetical protein [Archangium sp.]
MPDSLALGTLTTAAARKLAVHQVLQLVAARMWTAATSLALAIHELRPGGESPSAGRALTQVDAALSDVHTALLGIYDTILRTSANDAHMGVVMVGDAAWLWREQVRGALLDFDALPKSAPELVEDLTFLARAIRLNARAVASVSQRSPPPAPQLELVDLHPPAPPVTRDSRDLCGACNHMRMQHGAKGLGRCFCRCKGFVEGGSESDTSAPRGALCDGCKKPLDGRTNEFCSLCHPYGPNPAGTAETRAAVIAEDWSFGGWVRGKGWRAYLQHVTDPATTWEVFGSTRGELVEAIRARRLEPEGAAEVQSGPSPLTTEPAARPASRASRTSPRCLTCGHTEKQHGNFGYRPCARQECKCEHFSAPRATLPSPSSPEGGHA